MAGLSHHRPYLIPLYFTLGGVAGGLLFLAGLAELGGLPALAGAARTRDLAAIPLLLASGAILTADLTHPLRFYRLLLTFRPSSVVSWGSWILTGAGLVAALEAAPAGANLPVLGPVFQVLDQIRRASGPRTIHALACLLGIGLSGYTGVLLAASSRLRWYATPLLAPAFLSTGFTSAAALILATSAPAGAIQRALFVATLGILSASFFARHLEALEVEHRHGRLDPVLPPAARDWLGRASLAGVLATALLPLAAVTPTFGAPLALAVLCADLSLRFTAFWMEEGPVDPLQ